jgi:hypothetical protein
MNLNLKGIARQCLGLLFGIGDYAKAGVFVRPAGFNAATGTFTASEATASVQMVVVGYRPIELTDPIGQADNEKVIVRGADLTSIAAPGPGDYLVETANGQRRDVLVAKQNDVGEFWLFATKRSNWEDWGGLAAMTASEDRGDLTVATVLEDFGPLT